MTKIFYLEQVWEFQNFYIFLVLPVTDFFPSVFSTFWRTTWQYTIDNGQIQFAEKELLGKNRKSVSFYRLFSPVIATVDESLIKVWILFLLTKHWTVIKSIFVTHFNAFPTRMPFDSSLGAGKELNTSLDQVICYKIRHFMQNKPPVLFRSNFF